MNVSSQENIAIVLTPPGVGAIAVVRLRGAAVADFLQRHFGKPTVPGRCIRGQLHDNQSIIDDCIAVLVDPCTVDFCVHGGTWVVKSTLDLAAASGFSVTSDIQAAVDGDDPLEREMLAAIPLARTELALRTLLGQPSLWKNEKIDPGDCSLWFLLHPPQVAIIGAANVGKSTLANQLFAQERSITADIPGTTRDWVGEIANLDGLAVMLIDTPGIRPTQDPIEQQAIASSRDIITASELIVLVLDASRPLIGEQQALIDRWPKAIRVINQVDRPHRWDIAPVSTLTTIATQGVGVDNLRKTILAHFGINDTYEPRARWWTLGQRDELSMCPGISNTVATRKVDLRPDPSKGSGQAAKREV